MFLGKSACLNGTNHSTLFSFVVGAEFIQRSGTHFKPLPKKNPYRTIITYTKMQIQLIMVLL